VTGPADELKREHVRLGRQLSVREAIPFLAGRDPEAAAMLRELGDDFLDRPVFVHGDSGQIKEVKPGALGLEPLAKNLTYVRIDTK
jgi:hypothetical protein